MKYLKTITAIVLAMAIFFATPIVIHKIPDTYGGNAQWIGLICGTALFVAIIAGIRLRYEIRDSKLTWEKRSTPPTEPGKYLVRFDAKEREKEIIVLEDGRPYQRDQFLGKDPSVVTNLNKPMEWARVTDQLKCSLRGRSPR